MCDLPPENPTPFCGPPEGTQVRAGDAVEITWSARFFATSPTSIPRRIRIQADYFFANNNTRTGGGFTSLVISPASGRFTWRPSNRDLPPGVNSLAAAIFIAEPFTDSDGNGTTVEGNDRFAGPRVQILRRSGRNDGGGGTGGAIVNNNNNNNGNRGGGGNNNNNNNNMGAVGPGGPSPVAVALPIVLGVVTVVILVGFVMFRKRRPGWNLKEVVGKGVKGMMNLSGRRRMRRKANTASEVPVTWVGQRIRPEDIKVVTTDIQGLRMNAMRMAGGGVGGVMMSGGGGNGGNGGNGDGLVASEGRRNVFREEVRRQEQSMV